MKKNNKKSLTPSKKVSKISIKPATLQPDIESANVKTNVAGKNAHQGLIRIFMIIVNLVGFPVLALITGLTCKYYAESGIYKVTVYVPLLIVIAFWGITALLQLYVFRHDKKKHRSFKHTMLASVAIPVCMLSGIFLLLDIALPKLLAQASSNTILYEHIVVDAKGQHELMLSKADRFRDKNNLYLYKTDASGNATELYQYIDESGKPVLTIKDGKEVISEQDKARYRKIHEAKPMPIYGEDGKPQYLHWFSKENRDIFVPIFRSFDKAYQEFNGLAIEYALSEPDLLGGILSGKIPITVLLTIILDTSADKNGSDVKLDLLPILTMNKDNIVNAIKTLINTGLDFNTSDYDPYTGLARNETLDKILKSVMHHKEYEGIRWNVLQLLGENPLSNVDPNEKIIRFAGTENEEVVGAGLGYQDMAWLNSIDLLGIITCLMDCRKYFYIFAVVIGILTYLEFILRKQYLMKTGEDITLIPRSKKRIAKEEARNYFFAKSVNTVAELEAFDEDTLDPIKQRKEQEKEEAKANKKNKSVKKPAITKPAKKETKTFEFTKKEEPPKAEPEKKKFDFSKPVEKPAKVEEPKVVESIPVVDVKTETKVENTSTIEEIKVEQPTKVDSPTETTVVTEEPIVEKQEAKSEEPKEEKAIEEKPEVAKEPKKEKETKAKEPAKKAKSNAPVFVPKGQKGSGRPNGTKKLKF